MKIYMSTIVPILMYMLAVKLHLTPTQTKKLEMIEKRGRRIIRDKVPSIAKKAQERTDKLVEQCLNDKPAIKSVQTSKVILKYKITP